MCLLFIIADIKPLSVQTKKKWSVQLQGVMEQVMWLGCILTIAVYQDVLTKIESLQRVSIHYLEDNEPQIEPNDAYSVSNG